MTSQTHQASGVDLAHVAPRAAWEAAKKIGARTAKSKRGAPGPFGATAAPPWASARPLRRSWPSAAGISRRLAGASVSCASRPPPIPSQARPTAQAPS